MLLHSLLLMSIKAYLLVVLVSAAACGKSEPTHSLDPPATKPVASAAATGSASPVAPMPVAKPVRVAIRLNGSDVKLTIPSTRAATFGQDDWTKLLGMFATVHSDDEIVLQVGFVPKGDGQQDGGSVNLGEFQQQASFKQVVRRGETVTLVPDNALPGDGFGVSPPHELKVTWLR